MTGAFCADDAHVDTWAQWPVGSRWKAPSNGIAMSNTRHTSIAVMAGRLRKALFIRGQCNPGGPSRLPIDPAAPMIFSPGIAGGLGCQGQLPEGGAGEAAAQPGAAHRPASAVRVRVGFPITTAARRRERAHPEALKPATRIELDQTRTWSCPRCVTLIITRRPTPLSEVRRRGVGRLMRPWRAPSSRRPSR